MQDIHQVFSNLKYSIRQYRNLKGKDSIHHKKIEREETPYDPTILTKLAIHQDRAKSRTRERERDQTHSYWYISSVPRVNYSLLVMETAGMMKMAAGDDSPLQQGAGMGLDWFFMNSEACGDVTPNLG